MRLINNNINRKLKTLQQQLIVFITIVNTLFYVFQQSVN